MKDENSNQKKKKTVVTSSTFTKKNSTPYNLIWKPLTS